MNFQENKSTKNQGTLENTLELFPVKNKKVELNFNGKDISSDGGVLLLSEVENNIEIIEGICNCISDDRDHRYIDHSVKQMLSQRIY